MSKNKICQLCYEVEAIPGFNLCKECNDIADPKYAFTRIRPVSGDWEAWYMNGNLIAEGHRVEAEDLLDAIEKVFPNTVNYIEISDEKAEMGFKSNLEDINLLV